VVDCSGLKNEYCVDVRVNGSLSLVALTFQDFRAVLPADDWNSTEVRLLVEEGEEGDILVEEGEEGDILVEEGEGRRYSC